MSFVTRTLRDENWTRQGIKCAGCPIIWLQDFPDQPMDASGFYEVVTGIPGMPVMHACSEKCCRTAERITAYHGFSDDISFPIFRWKQIATVPADLGGGI